MSNKSHMCHLYTYQLRSSLRVYLHVTAWDVGLGGGHVRAAGLGRRGGTLLLVNGARPVAVYRKTVPQALNSFFREAW